MYHIAESNRTIGENGSILISNNGVLIGITHTPGTEFFYVNDDGDYFIQFTISYSQSMGGNMLLLRNGGYSVFNALNLQGDRGSVTYITIQHLTTNDRLSLINYSGAEIEVSAAPNLALEIVIFKVS